MSVPERVLDWASNAGRRAGAVALELTGFIGGRAVPALALNDVLGRITDAIRPMTGKAFLNHGGQAWDVTNGEVVSQGFIGTRIQATSTATLTATVTGNLGGFFADMPTIKMQIGTHAPASLDWELSLYDLTNDSAVVSVFSVTTTGTGTVAPGSWVLDSGTGEIPPNGAWSLIFQGAATDGDQVFVTNIVLES